jgi:hypothetical protein
VQKIAWQSGTAVTQKQAAAHQAELLLRVWTAPKYK